MLPVSRMVPLRLVAVICIGSGIPYLTLGTASEALRTAPIPLSWAPTLYFFTAAIAALLFLALRSRTSANARIYAACGAMFGLVPWGVYQLSLLASAQSVFLWIPLLVGLIAGAAAGWTIWRGDDGFTGQLTRR
jgi:hypothetical protein